MIPRIITIAFSSLGSSTRITWKRRASAASFSKYFLYSAQVVAAIAELAAGEGRLEQVGRVSLTGLSSCADHGVRFVDEEDDRHGRGFHLGDHLLEPVLEFALHAGPSLEQAKVEGPQNHLAERFGDVARRNSARQPFDDRRLPNPRFAGQDRVVLPPPIKISTI